MDFRGIVFSEGFSWPTPLRLRAEDGRRGELWQTAFADRSSIKRLPINQK
ncbi:hypothetical protein BSU04_28725 [Caballeronia sordidicola]|jgi:hypothetical protein|uniref:Uncharacterized protein n=1 Tax=Caballeronia sordidicola TaxID=196367 RepID=A0A226WVC3_CABSO|nr:hypothetical protein BSU04_28725 [Caballeronia sordidicola]